MKKNGILSMIMICSLTLCSFESAECGPLWDKVKSVGSFLTNKKNIKNIPGAEKAMGIAQNVVQSEPVQRLAQTETGQNLINAGKTLVGAGMTYARARVNQEAGEKVSEFNQLTERAIDTSNGLSEGLTEAAVEKSDELNQAAAGLAAGGEELANAAAINATAQMQQKTGELQTTTPATNIDLREEGQKAIGNINTVAKFFNK